VTPGSEPRHADTDEGVEDRVAEVIIEEMGIQAPPEDEEEPLPSISEQVAEQLGGVRGLIESSIPVLVFVILNVVLSASFTGLEKKHALYWAIGGSVASAVGIGVYRLMRKEPIRHAVNGIFGIAVGAYLAYRSGNARDFYLPGILLTFGEVVLCLISVVVRKPLIGYVWGVLANGGKHDWLQNKKLLGTFQWVTLVWAGSLFIRAGVQFWLYLADEANAIGIVRIVISWPIYAATFLFTIWAVRRVTPSNRPAATLDRTEG
jgi:hypothetical protein